MNDSADEGVEDKFHFFMDMLCDDYCEIDQDGYYQVKPEFQEQQETNEMTAPMT
jgi:hypothetical protein